MKVFFFPLNMLAVAVASKALIQCLHRLSVDKWRVVALVEPKIQHHSFPASASHYFKPLLWSCDHAGGSLLSRKAHMAEITVPSVKIIYSVYNTVYTGSVGGVIRLLLGFIESVVQAKYPFILSLSDKLSNQTTTDSMFSLNQWQTLKDIFFSFPSVSWKLKKGQSPYWQKLLSPVVFLLMPWLWHHTLSRRPTLA